MISTWHFPEKESFVAIWIVEDKQGKREMFCASMHYNAEEDQYYSYDAANDIFWPECDHGYSKEFFEKQQATYFLPEDY